MANEQKGKSEVTRSLGENKVEKQSFGGYELARAYVPWQRYTNRWDPMEGLVQGTIFPELYRPYQPRRNP
ncbi:spore coat associated protein CotJA [Moorella sulfitireducens (nom. illeg.)]|uniref:spore coat associated protein CotJA n=1 Tax=Neomoorella sulfitireducens TaxID=2972948 RepID=UPI0021AC16BA|nr:spore coat associated protein CotJA [Moorella sulfitireducens]